MKQPNYIIVHATDQILYCYEGDRLHKSYLVSTGKNGLGEQEGSECTPRGWHRIHQIIGLEEPVNSVFVGRQWTGEYYTSELAREHPNRDWILTRILQLDGLEEGRNKGGEIDTLQRYIYIHGAPEGTIMGTPGSRGCIRMRNQDIMELADWAEVDMQVCIVE